METSAVSLCGRLFGRPGFVIELALRVAVPIIVMLFLIGDAAAHEVGDRDAAFVAATRGPAPIPFLYLGAKHMVTGYDHLLFLLGVVFFLNRFRDVVIYVSLFSLGHSITLLTGVFFGFGANAYLIDAVIGLSLAYKAFDNLGGFDRLGRLRPNSKAAVFGFGLVHGLGLSTKLEALGLRDEGLLANLLAFNVGVEVGQIAALTVLVALLALCRRSTAFGTLSVAINWLVIVAGVVLMGYHLGGYWLEGV